MRDLEGMEHLGCQDSGVSSGTSLLSSQEQRARVLDRGDGDDQTIGVRDTGAMAAGRGAGLGKSIFRGQRASRAFGSSLTESGQNAARVWL
jgi:hypothetical protein